MISEMAVARVCVQCISQQANALRSLHKSEFGKVCARVLRALNPLCINKNIERLFALKFVIKWVFSLCNEFYENELRKSVFV